MPPKELQATASGKENLVTSS